VVVLCCEWLLLWWTPLFSVVLPHPGCVIVVVVSPGSVPLCSMASSHPHSARGRQPQPPIKLRKAVFQKVKDLEPESHGHNLHVKVVKVEPVLEKTRLDGSKVAIAEATVGDSTGCILLTCKNEQIPVVAEGASVTLRNAKVAMFKNHMRLAVDQWGLIEPSTEPLTEAVDATNNLSTIEYELVDA